MRKLSLLVVAVLMMFGLVLGLTACVNGDRALVGSWEITDDAVYRRIEFFSNGTVVSQWTSRCYSVNEWWTCMGGSWSIDGNRLSIGLAEPFSGLFTFSVSGNTLTLTSDRFPDEPMTLGRIR